MSKNEVNEQDDTQEMVTLTDKDGNDRDFHVLAELDYKDKWYIYLEPVDLEEDFKEGEIIIFEIFEDENGKENFNAIDDEQLLQEVFQLFLKEVEKTVEA